MKKALIFTSLMLAGMISRAQTFMPVQALSIPDSLAVTAFETIDVDLDGLQDVVIFADSPSRKYLLFIKGDTVNAPTVHQKITMVPDHNNWVFADEDLDNQPDLVLSTSAGSVILHNRGDFTFVETNTGLPEFSALCFTDLDGDGRDECIVSGNDNGGIFTRTYVSTGNSEWSIKYDSLTVGLSFIKDVDVDRNGKRDLIFSGKETDGTMFTSVVIGTGYGFKEHKISPVEGIPGIVDSNLDGFIDLIVYGMTVSGDPVYQRIPGGGDYISEDLGTSGKVLSAFHADLDSDGMPDQHTLIVTSANDTLNTIRFHDNPEEVLPHKDLVRQKFYDLDQDGDLDLVQLTSGAETTIRWYENTTASKNKGPGRFNAVALPVFDRVLLYWDVPTDDHTAGGSLTYDVYLEGATIGQDVSFDLEKGKRIQNVHGNNGTNNFLLLKNRGESFNYAIQAVDNSLFGSPEGICFGTSVPCAEQNQQVTSVCATGSVELGAPADALWFSFSKGFLGASTSYTYDPQSLDTVFYVIPTGECPLVMTFEFKTKEDIRQLEPETRFACTNADISLAADDTFADIRWSSQKNGIVGTSPDLTFKAESDDVIILAYTDEMQCAVEKEFTIKLSVPTVTASPPSHRILRGQSVQLSAVGAESYTWSPPQGLDNSRIANPVASPLSDTRYTVTGTDSVGCTATAMVDVLVESTGFIPSLFTPNGDGQNDLLRVYGLSTADNFSLQIVNREGSVVFRTSSIAEASGQGWDGQTNGIQQPNGVYFWKVEGQSPSGSTILLNGKEEGSLVLMR